MGQKYSDAEIEKMLFELSARNPNPSQAIKDLGMFAWDDAYTRLEGANAAKSDDNPRNKASQMARGNLSHAEFMRALNSVNDNKRAGAQMKALQQRNAEKKIQNELNNAMLLQGLKAQGSARSNRNKRLPSMNTGNVPMGWNGPTGETVKVSEPQYVRKPGDKGTEIGEVVAGWDASAFGATEQQFVDGLMKLLKFGDRSALGSATDALLGPYGEMPYGY